MFAEWQLQNLELEVADRLNKAVGALGSATAAYRYGKSPVTEDALTTACHNLQDAIIKASENLSKSCDGTQKMMSRDSGDHKHLSMALQGCSAESRDATAQVANRMNRRARGEVLEPLTPKGQL
jgi:hypothetical protein